MSIRKSRSYLLFSSVSSRVVPFIASLLMIAGCGQSDIQKVTLTGSSTIAPLAMELGLAFESLHSNVHVDVQTGGSSRGIADARSGLADIGMVSRALNEMEVDLLPHTIAYDGITLIVNKQNPIQSLSNAQVEAIYRGDINNWQQVSGPNQPITVVNKAEGRSTLELFLSYFKLENSSIKADVVVGDNQQGIKTVAGNPWAIAYVSVGTAEFEEQHGTAIKLLGVGGVEASTTAIKQGRYPLSRPLNVVTLGMPQGIAKEFIEFAQSRLANDIVEQQYFIPLHAD